MLVIPNSKSDSYNCLTSYSIHPTSIPSNRIHVSYHYDFVHDVVSDHISTLVPSNHVSLQKSSRIRKSPAYLHDYHCKLPTVSYDKTYESMSSGSHNVGDSYDVSSALSYFKLSPNH